ncbi:MAG: methionine synthase [Planctomycetota bacterium]|nr:methionine synthase [Planctomycetota bacterium]
MGEPSQRPELAELLTQRILVLDGATGTEIQAFGLGEEEYRGGRFRNWESPLKGNHDLLCLTRPSVVAAVHRKYLEAGADLIETNTFSANAISQSDYGLAEYCREINEAAARIARAEADAATAADPTRPRYVVGSIGPTNRTASLSPKVEDPGARNVSFEDLAAAYGEQARGLLDGGADLLLVETIFDVLNAKAAVFGIEEEFSRRGARVPLAVSATITDRAGRTLSGQTVEAFWTSIRHAAPLLSGLNCALGPREMRPHLEALHLACEGFVLCYANAGLPNEMGGYDLGPEEFAALAREFAEAGFVNLIGGCCGTTPAHVAAVARAVKGIAPRERKARRPLRPRWSGLEELELRPDSNLVNIGERCNVAGSRRFARLIREEQFEPALAVAREQVADGAQMLDLCFDEALLDAPASMRRFLRLLASDPEISRLPLVLDSSRFEAIEAGLKECQGRALVNSLSLKEGEDEFRRLARRVRRYGATPVVMAFDERGQADDTARRLEIVTRARGILADEGFADVEMVFDLNVLAIGTGLPEHDDYARSFLEALRELKQRFPGCCFSGGISNLSFSFRGAEDVRRALHSVFLFHAVRAGLTMGIVHAGQLDFYDDLDPALRADCEDLILNRAPGAADRMLARAQAEMTATAEGGGRARVAAAAPAWREQPVAERLKHALVHGEDAHLEADLPEALASSANALAVIEGPLMAGMDVVGELFGSGRMFLPQVVRSARVMKKAVAWLEPHLDRRADAAGGRGRVLLATVKGDVHDIGKNIVGVILACNGYVVSDLGVMVPAQKILDAARAEGSDVVGLSGLITPSLDEMVHVAAEMEREGLEVPLLIGGATTSAVHTAVKIAPARRAPVLHVLDASRAVGVMGELMDPERRASLAVATAEKQEELRRARAARVLDRQLLPLAEARARALRLDFTMAATRPEPAVLGARAIRDWPLEDLLPRVDWSPFFAAWELKGRYPEILDDAVVGEHARRLHQDALELLEQIMAKRALRAHAAFGIFPAASEGDDLVLFDSRNPSRERARLPMLRQQRAGRDGSLNLSLADFVAPVTTGLRDHVGAFVVTAGDGVEELTAGFRAEHDDYRAILTQALADRFAEALAERLHERARTEFWAYAPEESLDTKALIREDYRGIRPAPGYPACPNHDLKDDLFRLLDAEHAIGAKLTESWAITPTAAVAGLWFAHPEARYFGIGRIAEDQAADYAARRGIPLETARRRLSSLLD